MGKSLEERRQTLLALRQRFSDLANGYRNEVADIANNDLGINDTSAGSSGSEMADSATATYLEEMALTMRNRYRYRTTAVDEALTRVEQGTYGRCAICNKAISEIRLDLIPETPYCAEHAARAQAIDDQAAPIPKPWPGPSTAA